MIDIENQAKTIAIKNYESIEEFDKDVEPYLNLEYKKSRFFVRQFMKAGSDANKTLMFNSKCVSDYLNKHSARLHFDIIEGVEFKVQEIYEDDSRLFLIDLYPWENGVSCSFRDLFASSEHVKKFGKSKRIIFYDIDHKWKEISDNEIKNYFDWVPDNFQEELLKLALSK